MGTSDVKSIIEKVERLLAEEELSEKTELAIQELLNVVEALCADKQSLADEVVFPVEGTKDLIGQPRLMPPDIPGVVGPFVKLNGVAVKDRTAKHRARR